MKSLSKYFAAVLVFLFFAHSVSAVVLNSVNVDTFSPGSQGELRIEIKNILNDDVEDLSLALNFANVPFIPIGSSEQSVEEINEDDEEDFVFIIKSASDAKAGDYEIPYSIQYHKQGDSDIKTKAGSIGVKLVANPELSFSVSGEDAVVGKPGKINLQIVNKGFYDARFVSVRILPEDFSVLSDGEVYIGTIDSDDFETASFDVRFSKENPETNFIVEYTDFNNQKKIEQVNLPLTVYSEKRALEFGIIQKSSTSSYVLFAALIIVLLLIWRFFRKRKRMKKSRKFDEAER